MRNPHGNLTITSPESSKEYDTITCAHCNGVLVVRHRADPSELGGFCKQCMRHICNKKRCHEGCTPFEKRLEAYERRAALRRSVTGSA